jgi:hypothetical protein
MVRASMGMPADILTKVQAHFEKHLGACPLCESKTWNVGGPVAGLHIAFQPADPDPAFGREVPYTSANPFGQWNIAKAQGTPMVLAICGTCFYVVHFAMKPILEAKR